MNKKYQFISLGKQSPNQILTDSIIAATIKAVVPSETIKELHKAKLKQIGFETEKEALQWAKQQCKSYNINAPKITLKNAKKDGDLVEIKIHWDKMLVEKLKEFADATTALAYVLNEHNHQIGQNIASEFAYNMRLFAIDAAKEYKDISRSNALELAIYLCKYLLRNAQYTDTFLQDGVTFDWEDIDERHPSFIDLQNICKLIKGKIPHTPPIDLPNNKKVWRQKVLDLDLDKYSSALVFATFFIGMVDKHGNSVYYPYELHYQQLKQIDRCQRNEQNQ